MPGLRRGFLKYREVIADKPDRLLPKKQPDITFKESMNKTIHGFAVSAALTLGLLFAPTVARAQVPADAIDLSQVSVYNSPADIASWPATAAITQITMGAPNFGLSFEFTKKDSWPDYTPPGWTGPLGIHRLGGG